MTRSPELNLSISNRVRRRVMAGNWKMYKTAPQTVHFLDQFKPLVTAITQCDIVICPANVNISAAVHATKGSSIRIGGQNLSWAGEGAYTGEVSGEMLRAAGATWVIIGHSERRRYFHESDADVLGKTRAAIASDLIPIVCIGERIEEHNAGKTDEVLVRQFSSGIAGLTQEQFRKIVIAYEPVWAIGTGLRATATSISEAHELIRAESRMRFGEVADIDLRIVYGGSVNSDNVRGLMQEKEIDGVLVATASLEPQSFAKIVAAA